MSIWQAKSKKFTTSPESRRERRGAIKLGGCRRLMNYIHSPKKKKIKRGK